MGYRIRQREQRTQEGVKRIIGGKRFDEDGITNTLKSKLSRDKIIPLEKEISQLAAKESEIETRH